MKKAEILNLLAVAMLSLVFGAWSFFRFGSEASLSLENWDGALQFGENTASENLSKTVNGRDGVTLLSGAEANVTYDEDTQHLDVELKNGAMIFAASAGDITVSVKTDFVRIDSQENIAYVELEEGDLKVYSLVHPTLVNFTKDGKDLNALALASSYRMTVNSAKVSDKLSKLLLSKLSKEFPAYELSDEEIPENVKNELENIENRYAKTSADYLIELTSKNEFGPPTTGLGGKLHALFYNTRELMTFLPFAEEKLTETKKGDALEYAMTNAYTGNAESADFWLKLWQSYGENPERIKEVRSTLFFVLPGDELYDIKFAAESASDDIFLSLRRRYNEIEELLAQASEVEAGEAYSEYKTLFEGALNRGEFNEKEMLDELSREYMLIELLLRKNSIFYNTDSIELLSKIEKSILALSSDEDDMNEERQAFVQSKIRFLENLFDYVVERKVSITVASNLADELLVEAEDYLSTISSQVAVRSFFESKLEEFDVSIQFMNSPEFRSYASFEEGLADFKEKLADLDKLNDYIQNIRSGTVTTVSTLSLEDAIAEVSKDLGANGVQFFEVESLGDTSNRLFTIAGAKVAGNEFEGNYDRETHLLYDVTVGEIRFSTGILLENFRDVVEEALKNQIIEEEAEESETVEEDSSLTESVALNYAEEKFEDEGLEEFKILIDDLSENTFTFEGYLESGLLVSGLYDTDTGKVSGVIWYYEEQPKTLPDMKLENMEASINATYDALRE